MAQGVDQGAGAEPRLGQGWLQLGRAVVRDDGPAASPSFSKCDSQAEVRVGVARVAGHGAAERRDRIR
jgi:hypothetical protein